MSQNNQTQQVLGDGFGKVVRQYPAGSENVIMTDILLQANAENGQFSIYDDDDNEIFSSVVEEWAGNTSEEFYAEVGKTLRDYIQANLAQLENLALIKPYSFILIDDEKETVCELHLVDDKLIVVDSTALMQNLDKDLDDFFERLMKE